MKVDLSRIHQLGISPNALYLLFCLKHGYAAKYINVVIEQAVLLESGYLKSDLSITHQGEALLARASYVSKSTSRTKVKLMGQDIPFVGKYRELFPKGEFPSGSAARSSVQVLTGRFEVFFAKHPEYRDWNVVLQATALYLDEAEDRQFEYTQTSENFIYKLDVFKNWQSRLAQYCQMILDGSAPSLTGSAPSIITIPGLH